MRSQTLQFISVISVLVWLSLLVDVYRMFAQAVPAEIQDFAMRHRVLATFQVLALVVPGAVLSIAVWLRHWSWAAVAVSTLAALALWHMYLSGASIHFRPPRGDGSVSTAIRSWIQFHSTFLGWHIAKIALLNFLFVTWLVVYVRLWREQRRQSA